MRTDKPIISVIMPVYNMEKYLHESIKSVLNQTLKNIEIICIDDCSTDSSLNILQEYAKQDKRLKIISHSENLGCVATKNEGIKKATGEYIYPFDSDDIILPQTLEKLYNAIINKLGDIISCDVKLFGEKNCKLELPEPTIYNMANQNCIINSSLFRRSDFLKLSGEGYDLYFDKGLEDYDLWLNFVFHLHKRIYRIPETLYYYRIKTMTESRNLSSASQHYKYIQYLKLKYPETNIFQMQEFMLKILQQRTNKQYIKLFKIIPFLKIKNRKGATIVYLFNCIPILKLTHKY